MKSVAKNGEVIPIPGTKPYPPATNGVWIPMPIKYKTHKTLTITGVPAILEASCKFMFVGVDTKPVPPVPVTGNEEVKLEAKKTVLTDSGESMLLMGDEKEGQYGNKLQVLTFNLLKTKPA